VDPGCSADSQRKLTATAEASRNGLSTTSVVSVMAKSLAPQSSSPLARVPLGPKIMGLGAVLFVVTRIIKWLPLDWIDGPINALLWLAIIGCLAVGGGITYLSSKRS